MFLPTEYDKDLEPITDYNELPDEVLISSSTSANECRW
jgi:hypothetical protein